MTNKVRIGSKIIITNVENEGYKRYLGKKWKVVHIAHSIKEHPGYDEAMEGQLLVSCDGLPFSLYEWEFERI